MVLFYPTSIRIIKIWSRNYNILLYKPYRSIEKKRKADSRRLALDGSRFSFYGNYETKNCLINYLRTLRVASPSLLRPDSRLGASPLPPVFSTVVARLCTRSFLSGAEGRLEGRSGASGEEGLTVEGLR